MARVLMSTQAWGVLLDASGNVQAGVSATVKNRDGTNATHYSARTGGSSLTTSITSSSTGTLDRWINPGSYTVTVGANTYDIEAEEAHPAFVVDAAGSSDDSSVIQAAIDSVFNAGGGRVVGRKGVTLTCEGVDVKEGVTLDLSGVTLKHKASSSTFCVRVSGADGAVVGGHVDGNSPNISSDVVAIQVTGNRARVQGVRVYDAEYHAIQVTGAATQVSVLDNWVYKVNAAVSTRHLGIALHSTSAVDACTHVLVAGNHVRDTTMSGMGVNGVAKYVTFSHNVLVDTGEDGIAAYDASNEHVLAVGNSVYSPANNGMHLGGRNISAVGNTLRGITQRGISMYCAPNNDPTANNGVVVSGNLVDTTGDIGIFSQRMTDVSITGNVVLSTTLPGITVTDCTNVSLGSNTVRGGSSHGVHVIGCVDVAINGGLIKSNAGNGIGLVQHTRVDTTVVETTDVEIAGALIKGNTGWGVLASNSTARVSVNAAIRGNTAGNVSLAPNRTTHQVVPAKTDTTVSLASATTLTLPPDLDYFNITGTTSITSVTTSWPGRRVTLSFAGILTFTDGSNLKLAGNFVTTADDTISLVSDGTSWIETSRSVN